MGYKDIHKRRECRRKWYSNNKESEREHIYRRKREIALWFEEYRKTLKCKNCPESFHGCLQFHHRDALLKDFDIKTMVTSGYSKDRILAEIEKCDVLCANCHCKEHYKLRHYPNG